MASDDQEGWAALQAHCLEEIVCRAGGAAAVRCELVCRSWRQSLDDSKLWMKLYQLDVSERGPGDGAHQQPWRLVYLRNAKQTHNWENGTPRARCITTAHASCITGVVLTSETVITGSYDRCVKIWDRRSGQWLNVLQGHSGPVTCVDGAAGKVASGARDRTIRLWDVSNGCVLEEWDIGDTQVRSVPSAVAVLPLKSTTDLQPAWRLSSTSTPQRHKLLVVAANTVGGIEIWKQGDGPEPCITVSKHVGAIYGMCVAETGHCFSASLDWTLRTFDLATGQETSCLQNDEGLLSVAQQDEVIVAGTMDNMVRVFDRRMYKCAQTMKGHCDWVRGVGIHNHFVVSGGKDQTVRLWDMRNTGKEIKRLVPDIAASTADIRSLSLDPQTVAYACADGSMTTLDFGADPAM